MTTLRSPAVRAAGIFFALAIAPAPAIVAGCTQGSPAPAPDASVVAGDLPCDVEHVLVTVCQHCHTSPPRNEAPFPLVTYADTQVTMSGHPVWTFMLVVLESERMPLPPVQIEPRDRATLLAWLRAGAPAASGKSNCAARDASPADDAPDVGAPDTGPISDTSVDDPDCGSDAGSEDLDDASPE
jgi:uncharacterized membrane protein